MTRLARLSDLRQLHRNTGNMARLSPFKVDGERFRRMARAFRGAALSPPTQ